MIDTVQAVLLFVIILLTILLIVLGIQVFFILRDVRRTLGKANKVLDNTKIITDHVTEPMSLVTSLFAGGSSLSAVTKILSVILKKKE